MLSNTGTAAIFLPVLAKLAEVHGVNPIYYTLAGTAACSFAFMLPVATPPNAVVYGSGLLTTGGMVRVGVVLNFLCVSVSLLALHTLGVVVFQVLTLPDWATPA